MIKNFSVSNYNSIKEKQTISFEILPKDMLDDSSFQTKCRNNLNSIIAIIGNNSAGKSNILKALADCLIIAQNSYTLFSANDPIFIFLPFITEKHKNTTFEIIFETNNKEYKYKLEMNSGNICYEYLGMHNKRAFSTIYEITREKDKVNFLVWKFEKKLNDIDRKRFEERTNSTLFSFLLNTGHLAGIGVKEITNYDYNFKSIPVEIQEDRLNKISQIMKNFDLGFAGFSFTAIQQPRKENPLESETKKILLLNHKTKKGNFSLPFDLESDGTQKIVYLLNKLLAIIEAGGIAICDEIESSIHPYLIKNIINNLFANKEINKNNAQLIFSTHLPWLLEDRTKTQIYLVEKNEGLSTELYRLDEVEGVRNDDNFCNKYLAGAYGAVANLRWF